MTTYGEQLVELIERSTHVLDPQQAALADLVGYLEGAVAVIQVAGLSIQVPTRANHVTYGALADLLRAWPDELDGRVTALTSGGVDFALALRVMGGLGNEQGVLRLFVLGHTLGFWQCELPTDVTGVLGMRISRYPPAR